MSDSLLKANSIVVKTERKRVIDSNQQVSERLEALAEILKASEFEDEMRGSGFVAGLDALRVEELLEDPDAEGEFTEGLEYEDASEYEGPAPSPVSAEEIQQIIDDANTQAEEIITNAHEEAQGIINSANSESESIRAAAKEEGYNAGFEAGNAAAFEQLSQSQAELERQQRELEAAYEARIEELEPMLVEALTDIYSHVFGIDLSGRNELVLNLLKDTIMRIEGTSNYMIHVSKDDYLGVCEARDELIKGLSAKASVEIIEDVTLKASECFIEADSGIFDCTLGTELELLKKELRLISYTRGDN